jgi:hypothetical protein
VFYSEARRQHLKRCFEDLLDVTSIETGVHPKMAYILEGVFQDIERVGGDVGRDKRRRKNQHTWKDSNRNTLYLD